MTNIVQSYAFIYAAVSCAVLCFVFFSGATKKKRYSRYLHVSLLALGLHVVYKLIGLLMGNATWLELPLPTGLLYPALLYLLACRFYQRDRKTAEGQKILFFLPYLVFTGLFALAVYASPQSSLQLLYSKGYYVSLMLSMLIHATMITGLYSRYQGNYHALDLLIKQLTMICFGLVVFACLRLYEIAFPEQSFGFEAVPLVYLFLLLGLALVLHYYFVGRLEDIRSAQEVQGHDGVLASALTNGETAQYAAIVERELIANRLFLNPSLSLDVLAQQTAIPRHHLSQLFNGYYGKSFYQFIAEQRIAHAMERIVELGHTVTLDSLSYECGFNSKTSFNRYFKAQTGMTPSEFRVSHSPNFHIVGG